MPIDYRNYPDNWHEISDRIRFQRAQGRCECDGRCGAHDGTCDAMHGEPHPVTSSIVLLTTMHLDHDTTNNDDDNLMAGCQRCHLNYDSDHHRANAARTRRQRRIDAGQMVLL